MATDEEKQTLISNFVNITSASQEEAQFYLESHNFQIDSAIQSFFENDDNFDSEPLPVSGPQVAAAAAVSSADPTPQSSVPHPVPASTGSGGSRSKSKTKKRSGGIRTLADLKNESGSDSDEDGPQEYYTGGEKSGMLVQDPTRRGGNHDIDSLFEQARQMGAQQGPFEHEPSSSSRSFTGTGRLLSGETVAAAAAPRPPETVIHNIYFWMNGFTVDDGPLRRFDDPANASFLESIKKSECPKELEPADRRSPVNVNLRRMPENYTEPKKHGSAAAFQGTGRTLGTGSSSTQPVTSVIQPVTSVPVTLDDSKPSTSIQLRLGDGSRTIGRFNMDHTVGDIRSYINNHLASNGRAVAANYTLQTVGFPPKKLEDDGQTIEQAGLANSVVIQKL